MKVLLLDSAFASAPIYEYLTQSGHEVWVMGNRSGDLLARKSGEYWINQDYSQLREVEHYISKHSIDYVVPGCTDVSMDTFSQLESNSNLRDSFGANRVLGNKASFRSLCAKLELPAPQVLQPNDFPVFGQFICKPVDSFSGRGITIFDGKDTATLNVAIAYARKWSPSSTAIIETFVSGDLYSCSAFAKDRRLAEVFYVREGSSANPFAVDTSFVTDHLPKECTRVLETSLEKVCSTLELKDGLLHCQFLLKGQTPYIVEMSRRCPGDLYPLLIEYSTGFRYAAKYASHFTDAAFDSRKTERKYILRHTVTSLKDSVFSGIRFNKSPSVKAFFPLQAMGQLLLARQGNRAGILFCESPDRRQLLDEYEWFVSRSAYDVE